MVSFVVVEAVGGDVSCGAGVWDLFWACLGVVGFGGGSGRGWFLLGEEEFEVGDEVGWEVFEIGVW